MVEHDDTADLPNYADVMHKHQEVVEAAARSQHIVDHVPRAVSRIAREQGLQAGNEQGRKFGLYGLIVALLVSTLAGLVAGGAYQTSIAARDEVMTVQAAVERLATANRQLENRGQEPVSLPSSEPTDAFAAAILAQVLASLPQSPSADQVAARIQGAVVATLVGPTQDELTRQVASYFATNPPQPGPPPSEAAIQAAVDRAYAENPPRDGLDGVSPPCLAEPSQCRGADGESGTDGADGAPGRSVLTGPEPVRLDNGDCVWRSTFDQPPLVEEYPAGNAACPGGLGLGVGDDS